MSPIALERTKSGNAWRMSGHPKIDKEISALLPSLSPEEQAGLEKDVVENGCRDCLIVWDETDVLIEGHHRLAICKKHDISYYVRFESFPSREKVLQWVINNQRNRRNMSKEQLTYVLGKDYLLKKGEHGGDRKSEESSVQNGNLTGRTVEEVADKYKVGTTTVKRAAEFAESLDDKSEEERRAVLDGDVKLPKAAVIAAPAILCESCKRRKRVGQPLPENCSACKEVRKPDDPPPKPKTSKNGKPTFNDKRLNDAIEKLGDLLMERAKTLKEQRSGVFGELRKKWDEFVSACESWQVE